MQTLYAVRANSNRALLQFDAVANAGRRKKCVVEKGRKKKRDENEQKATAAVYGAWPRFCGGNGAAAATTANGGAAKLRCSLSSRPRHVLRLRVIVVVVSNELLTKLQFYVTGPSIR